MSQWIWIHTVAVRIQSCPNTDPLPSTAPGILRHPSHPAKNLPDPGKARPSSAPLGFKVLCVYGRLLSYQILSWERKDVVFSFVKFVFFPHLLLNLNKPSAVFLRCKASLGTDLHQGQTPCLVMSHDSDLPRNFYWVAFPCSKVHISTQFYRNWFGRFRTKPTKVKRTKITTLKKKSNKPAKNWY